MSIHNYTLGQLIYRVLQYNEAQTRRPEDNSILYWKSFASEFFTENAIFKYGVLVCSVGGGKHFEPFVLPSRLLPRYFKSLYQDAMSSCSCVLDNPQEYSPAPNTYVLDCPNARIISVFDETQICTYGSLKVTFAFNLKIVSWVFDAHKYVDYVPYASIEAKIASFMNYINTQIPDPQRRNSINTSTKINHNNIDTTIIKTEKENESPTTSNSEKPTAQPPFLDIECNGISSPSTDIPLDTFLNNDDEPNSTNTSTSSLTNSKSSIKESQNTDDSTNNTTNKTNNSKNPSTNGEDVLSLVRTQLQTTFKNNSPVNQFGLTPQVMRCFEISDILLSMEDLMDYCLQSGVTPRSMY